MSNQVALSQCPLCGEETDPDAVDDGIDEQKKRERGMLKIGFILGAAGMALVIALFGAPGCSGIL